MKTFFKKLEYRFLVESIKIKNASFPCKIAIPEANVKTNRTVSTNETITKNAVFPVTTLFFWKFCFSLSTSYKRLISCANNPNAHIHTFYKHWSLIWRCFFPVSILKRIVKWTEPCKCVILLVSKIVWHMRINPSLKEWGFWYLILTGEFPPWFLLSSLCSPIPVKAAYLHWKKLVT